MTQPATRAVSPAPAVETVETIQRRTLRLLFVSQVTGGVGVAVGVHRLRSLRDGSPHTPGLPIRRHGERACFTSSPGLAQGVGEQRQSTGLVGDNRAEPKPALDQLTKVLAVLQKHEKDLGDTIAAMAPFTRLFSNVLGNGRWFDSFVDNLLPAVVGGVVCGGASSTPLPAGCSEGN